MTATYAVEIHTTTETAYGGARLDLLDALPDTVTRILDVGCFRGATGRAARQRFRLQSLVGIECLAGPASDAATAYDDVIVGDLDDPATHAQLSEYTFDAIIYGDVLEHLRDPWEVVRRHTALLAPQGTIVVSLPNVCFYDVFFQLLVRGRWPRRHRGIFDKTHLRWFTRKDALELLECTGLRAHIAHTHYRLVEHPHSINRFAAPIATILVPLRRFLAFQYVIAGSWPTAGAIAGDASSNG